MRCVPGVDTRFREAPDAADRPFVTAPPSAEALLMQRLALWLAEVSADRYAAGRTVATEPEPDALESPS
jgi:hypothetical protein